MSNANDRQVAGSHYKGKVQHWDLVAMYNLDYFIGNATKYLFRFGKKGTLKDHMNDLEKAKHYIEKRIEMLQSDLDALEEVEATQHINTIND